MHYELAKELKDAGFPFVIHHPNMGMDNVVSFGDLEDWKVPTLSELVEACGNNIVLHNLSGGKWQAGIGEEWSTYNGGIDSPLEPMAEGDTPEEAVTKLWLSIQHKSKVE